MNLELERKQIIDEIKNVKDEWLLRAIKRLLCIEDADEVPEEHKRILDSRIDEFESGNAKTTNWEDIKKRLYRK